MSPDEPSIDLDVLEIPEHVRGCIDGRIMCQRRLIPIAKDETSIMVAMSDPSPATILELEMTTGKTIRPVRASDDAIGRALQTYYPIEVTMWGGFVNLDALEIPPEIIALVDRTIAHAYRCIPVSRAESLTEEGVPEVVIVLNHSLDERVILELEFLLDHHVGTVYTTPDAIDSALRKYYGIDPTIPPPFTGDELMDMKAGISPDDYMTDESVDDEETETG